MNIYRAILGAVLSALVFTSPTQAYSVLTHEAIIDAVWASDIRPMLVARFPNATPDDLRAAHAYVYGGCLTQDMGYVPFSSKLWSDLAHYVRSGDLVSHMLRDAQTLNEYAFALGSLAHYIGDSTGHPVINRIEPLTIPKLRRKFGPVVTYEDNPVDHLKTEFSLDVIQVAREQYAPDAYHDFIGFEIAQSLVERAFQDTYGIEFKDLFKSEDLAIGTYRFTVGKLVPEMTKAAWESKRKDIENLSPGITRSRYLYRLKRRQFEREWGKSYHKPGIGARFIAVIFRIIPTFGPFHVLGFRPVPPQGEKMFVDGFDHTVASYRAALAKVRGGNLDLPNVNLDTGDPVHAGSYRLADKTYDDLLERLAKKDFAGATPGLRADVLRYYGERSSESLTAKDSEHLDGLKQASALP